MARIRTIKPRFWKHEELSALPAETHMLAAALLNYADDYGYFNAHPGLIKAECFPLRELSVSVPESLRSLQAVGFILLGKGEDGKTYGKIMTFDEHQRVSHPTTSEIADKSIVWDQEKIASGKIPENIPKVLESLRPERGMRNEEREGNEEKSSVAKATAASPLLPSELKRLLWDTGKAFLCDYGGMPKDRAGSLLGKWRKEAKNNDQLVLDALTAAQSVSPSDLVSFIEGTIRHRLNGNGSGQPKHKPVSNVMVGTPEFEEMYK